MLDGAVSKAKVKTSHALSGTRLSIPLEAIDEREIDESFCSQNETNEIASTVLVLASKDEGLFLFGDNPLFPRFRLSKGNLWSTNGMFWRVCYRVGVDMRGLD